MISQKKINSNFRVQLFFPKIYSFITDLLQEFPYRQDYIINLLFSILSIDSSDLSNKIYNLLNDLNYITIPIKKTELIKEDNDKSWKVNRLTILKKQLMSRDIEIEKFQFEYQ